MADYDEDLYARVKKKTLEAKQRQQQYANMAPTELQNQFLAEKSLQQMQQAQSEAAKEMYAPNIDVQQSIQPQVAAQPAAAKPAATQPAADAGGTNMRYNVATGQWENIATKQTYAEAPAELDKQIAMLKGQYASQEKLGNIPGMIWAAEQADIRRQELGLPPINTELIQRLKQQAGQPAAAQPTAAQPTAAQPVAAQPAVTYTPQGIPTLTQPQYQQYTSPYEQQIKQVLDQIASQPAYESPYAAILNEMVNKITTRTFDYDPEKDPEFQRDSQILTQAIMQEMSNRGLLSSTITADRIQQGLKDMLIDYRSKAYQQYLDEGQQLLQQANFIMGVDQYGYEKYQDEYTKKTKMLEFLTNLDDRQYELYKEARDADYEMRKDQYQSALNQYNMQQQRIEDAWDRVSELGYVDNEASIILGIPPGTLSKEARAAKESREQQIEDAEKEYQQQIKKLEAQHEMDKEMEAIKYQYDIAREAYKGTGAKTYTATEIKNLTPSELGNAEQVKTYNEVKAEILKQANGDANKALLLAYNIPDLPEAIGGALYSKLISDLEAIGDVQKTLSAQEETILGPKDYYNLATKMKEATNEFTGERIYTDKEIVEQVMNYPIDYKYQAEILDTLYPKGEADEILKAKIEEEKSKQSAKQSAAKKSIEMQEELKKIPTYRIMQERQFGK